MRISLLDFKRSPGFPAGQTDRERCQVQWAFDGNSLLDRPKMLFIAPIAVGRGAESLTWQAMGECEPISNCARFWRCTCCPLRQASAKTHVEENSMPLSNVLRTLLIFGLTFVAGSAWGQELAPLPAGPSVESLQRIAALSSAANPQAAELSQEARWRRAAAKESVPIFQRQALWPVHVETADGPVYWGEITKIGDETFELMNRKTNQSVTLTYALVRGIGIAKAYPRTKPPSATEKSLQRTGEVVSIILLLPVRILELFLVPQC
jgi:hypothetical protein